MRGDTIAAIATASGPAGVAIVRVSGPNALKVLKSCFRPASGRDIAPGQLTYGHLLDAAGGVLDEVLAVFMKGPHSYTREDVAEIHCHGGDLNAARALRLVVSLGARLAQPGEFTKRAFLNGRIDLSQAEAVMALVGAGAEAAARAAIRQMEGGVSKLIQQTAQSITDLLALIEAGDDFPDEIEEQATRENVLKEIGEISRTLRRAADGRCARILRNGAVAALCGRPNTGKSSLMNALLGWDRAIVTSQPGTTRDLVSETMEVNGLALTLTDTAGQRDTPDQVEKIGVERARKAEREADLVLAVLDASEEATPEDMALLERADERYVAVVNKCDLPMVLDLSIAKGVATVCVSALTGRGMDDLCAAIRERLSYAAADEALITDQRQIELAGEALLSLDRAREGLLEGFEADVVAVDLQEALEKLWSIVGKNVRESVIDRVFAMFCVGK